MNKKDYFEKKYKSTVDDCRILYKDNFCNWDVEHGWYDILSEFSYLCEELNIRFYKKYRFRISLEQIKQKFGTLRIYATVVQDPCRFSTWIIDILKKVISKLKKIDYNLKRTTCNNSHSNYVIEIYDTENELTNDKKNGSNVTISQIKDKFVKTIKYKECEKIIYKPTKYKIIYYFKCVLEKITRWLFNFSFTLQKLTNSKKDDAIMEYMNIKMDKFISEYEHKSENICERCGYVINKNYDSVCYTIGWITTLCESCAQKSGYEYEMDGKIYNNGTFIRNVENGKNNI